jgi:general secretion pathway protein K
MMKHILLNRNSNTGAALLSAMLTVTLVATFAAAALWQQWRSVEVEIAERGRVQVAWLLIGSLDWSRLILRIDGNEKKPNEPPTDNLNEAWATELKESRLSTFLAADKDNTGGLTAEEQVDAFLSGGMVDAQSKLNVFNLIVNGQVSATDLAAFTKLFALLDIQNTELQSFVANLQAAINPQGPPTSALLPKRVRQLTWLGLKDDTLAKLSPYITLLPDRTTVNLNTAPVEVIFAIVPGLQPADAKLVVSTRNSSYFRDLADAETKVPALKTQLKPSEHSVITQFFEVTGRIRLEQTIVEVHSLVDRRDISNVKTLWLERSVAASP